MKWLRDLFRPEGVRVELRLMPYAEADRTLILGNGEWQIAPEEDMNRRIGYVWLERRVKLRGTATDTGTEHG